MHHNIALSLDPKWMVYIFYKGFVGVNGCSLTVGQTHSAGFVLHLIPETLALTNLSELVVGDYVNIEIDSQTQVIVDTVVRVLAAARFRHRPSLANRWQSYLGMCVLSQSGALRT
jgi:riboflavin synthase